MVDKRSHLGGSRYPDIALYRVFVLFENMFSTLVNTYNFSVFGSTLLDDIFQEIQSNSQLVTNFHELFESEVYTDATMNECLEYYVKVFGNVQAKDLAFRFNRNINKGPEVRLRRTLAAA